MAIPDDYGSLKQSHDHAESTLERVRGNVPPHIAELRDHICVMVVGSYGRHEADSEASDFEWITVYDDARVSKQEADKYQADLTAFFAEQFGRNRLSIGKTFGEVFGISDLVTNVGGEADSNRTLTYRMLTLTEGVPLLTGQAHERILHELAKCYANSHTAGHRLLSLATDVARYWRTLRVDYKFKVDEAGKSWAVRSMKLRSYRRFWYFSSAVYFLSHGPRINYEEKRTFDLGVVQKFMTTMGGSPTLRLLAASETLGMEDQTKEILSTYDAIHAKLSSKEVRDYLDGLEAEARYGDVQFQEIRNWCKALHRSMATFVLQLPEKRRTENDRIQMLEMFLL